MPARRENHIENLAPIALFVYNRPENTIKTIQALKKNNLAMHSNLIIFSDGPRSIEDVQKVNEVRGVLESVEGFKSVKLIKSNSNLGLANSIISGVTKILKEFQKIIVLEDDLITSEFFLEYMNDALNFYEKSDIWSISGYTPKMEFPTNYNSDVYFVMRACSWGWGTWIDRWEKIDWDITDYNEFLSCKKQKKLFNKSGNDMVPMLIDQKKGNIDSWAIRWCYNQFRFNQYSVYPRESFVQNNGIQGEGTHGSFRKNFEVDLIKDYKIEFENFATINDYILSEFVKNYNLKLYNYIARILKKIGVYKKVKVISKKVVGGIF